MAGRDDFVGFSKGGLTGVTVGLESVAMEGDLLGGLDWRDLLSAARDNFVGFSKGGLTGVTVGFESFAMEGNLLGGVGRNCLSDGRLGEGTPDKLLSRS